MRSLVFCSRNRKEILRDPLSYIFCLGFPIVMFLIMTVVNQSISKEAPMQIFHIENLAPGMTVFGLTFVMLFNCIQVSKDRSTAFLVRMYISPLKPKEYVAGYLIPLILLSYLQMILIYIAAMIIAACTGATLSIGGIVLSMICLFPSVILFASLGMMFGTILNEKAAPGACSIIISAAGMLGGIWMDVESIGGFLKQLCIVLPFYHAASAARAALQGEYSKLPVPILITSAYAIVIFIVAAVVFHSRMQKDLK